MVSILPLIYSSPSLFFSCLWGKFQGHQLLLVSLLLSCSFFFFLNLSGKVQVFIYLFTFFQLYFVVCRNSKVHLMTSFSSSQVFEPGLSGPREFYGSYFLVCAYTICLYGQVLISCTIPRGLPWQKITFIKKSKRWKSFDEKTIFIKSQLLTNFF